VVGKGKWTLRSTYVLEDPTSDVGQLGDEVHAVLELFKTTGQLQKKTKRRKEFGKTHGRLPVLLLVDTLPVGLGEGRVMVELLIANHSVSKTTLIDTSTTCGKYHPQR
jgi:hypothetical protein